MAKSGPAVMAAAGERKRQSNRLQAHVPSWSSRGALSHGVKTTRPCSVPRTARTRDRPTNRPSRRINSSAGQATPLAGEAASFHLRHDDRVKKGAPRHLNSYPFPLPLSLSCYMDRERGSFERDPSPRRKRAPSPPTDQGFQGGPSEGFDNRPRALGLHAHY
jgi:hypothetical protein